MPRVRGMHGQRLDNAVERVEGVVARVLRGIARTIAALVGASPSTAALSDDDLQPIRQVWEKAVGEDIVQAVAEAYAESARTLAGEFADAGRAVAPLTLDAPEAADFLDAATNRLVGVSDTLWDIARKELADGVRAGDGVEELAARLQEAGGFGIARARMIARTEVVAAANAASLAQALRLGDASMLKVWMDADDDRVRAAHEVADGQTVPVGEPFEVGGESLMYPGQPIGSPSNTINERCGLGYSWDEPLTAAAEVHTGAMVALRPSAEDAKRLAVDGGEPADQLHCTQAYLGEAADIPPEVRRAIIDRLRSLVEDAIRPDYDLPLVVDGFAVSMFNPPGAEHPDGRDRSSCVVLGLSGDDLDSVHKMIVSTVEEVYAEHGSEMPAQHAPYNAHLTLEYTDDPHRVEELMDRAGPVTFDAIRVAFGGENVDIPLNPVGEAVDALDFAAIEPKPEDAAGGATDSPAHIGGVDLADSSVQVDAWGDGTFSINDRAAFGLWLDEDEANDLIDTLNQVRSGGPATTIDVGAGGLEVAMGDDGQVLLVPQNAADGLTLSDDDAYELSYWLAYWLDRGGYYDEGAEAAEDQGADGPLTAATRRPWDPLKHPRGPDGRFIGKGIVGRASGDAGKSKAVRRTDPPAALPPRPGAPEDPRRAELSKLRVAELRRQARDAGLKPGRARKAELIDMLAERGSAAPVEPVPDAPSQQQADVGPQVLSPSGQEMRSVLQDRSLEELQDTAADVGIDPGDSSRNRLAVRLASVLAGGPDPVGPVSVRAAGSDQTDTLSADLDQDRAGFDARSKAAFNAPYDLHLEWLTERAGFNARPQVASREELDAAVSAGWAEVWRGVTNGGGKTASEINTGLREGVFEPGRGNYGNGVYTSTRRNTAETYRGVEPRVNHPARGDDFTPDDLEGDPPPDSLLRIAIDPTARVGDYDQLLAELNQWRADRPSATPSADTFADVGRYATARGYDVVRVVGHDDGGFYPGWEESDGDEPGADQYVILNRSAIMIQRPEDAP